MRTLAVMAAALGLVGTIAVGTAPPAAADWYYGHHRPFIITVAEPGTAASLAGPYRAAFVSPIAMVRGTLMDLATTAGVSIP
jgi:hypothetical protein